MKNPKTGGGASASGDLNLGQGSQDGDGSNQNNPPDDNTGKHVPTREDLDTALAALPDDHNTDADYVVRAMRSHFGELFTEADEVRVRELVVAPTKDDTAKQPPTDNKTQADTKTSVGPAVYRFTQRVEWGGKDGKRVIYLPDDPPRPLSKTELKEFAGLVEEVKAK